MGLFSSNFVEFAIINVIISFGMIIGVAVGSVGALIMMTDHERANIWIQILMVIIVLPSTYYLTVNYGVIGLAYATALKTTSNNIIQLLYIRYAEGFMSITKHHIYLISGYILISVTMIVIKSFISIFLVIPISILVVTVFVYFNYYFVLDDMERRIINNKLLSYYELYKNTILKYY